jgi:medium-chain acyl-[acyl-carrier-protein] hydrolase
MLPGRETRISEPLFTEIDPLLDAIASELRPWLDIPYAVFGHSMGALLAFEWAHRMQQEGHPLPQVLFLSGRRAPDASGDPTLLQSLTDRDFIEELTRRFDGIPPEILHNAEHMKIYLPILRADIAVVESHRYKETKPLDCPITVFAGIDDRSVTWNQMDAWKRHTNCHCTFQYFPGGHFYPQQPLLHVISATTTALNNRR